MQNLLSNLFPSAKDWISIQIFIPTYLCNIHYFSIYNYILCCQIMCRISYADCGVGSVT